MDAETAVRAAEQTFFSSLLAADVGTLDGLLADDFQIIDVVRGGLISKSELLGAIGVGLVRFDAVEPAEAHVRVYGDAAVVTGRTRMQMSFGPNQAEIRSRYTHVFVRQGGSWLLVSAQGTQIVEG
jgi:ketosteroid isomerase-like protein